MESSIFPPHNATPNAEAPCPLCGRSTAPYDQRAGALLDMVLLIEAVVQDLRHAAEEVAQ